jgi:hypothetical protein
MERATVYTDRWWESQKDRAHKKDIDVSGRIILKRILEK